MNWIVLAKMTAVQHGMRWRDKPVALIWRGIPTGSKETYDEDLAKAKTYAEKEGYTVFEYGESIADPLGRAKEMMQEEDENRRGEERRQKEQYNY